MRTTAGQAMAELMSRLPNHLTGVVESAFELAAETRNQLDVRIEWRCDT